MNRREFLKSTGALSLAPLSSACTPAVRWDRESYRKTSKSRVAVLPATSYDKPLEVTVRQGLALFSLDVRGKTILLKPNLVEYDPDGVINTHPALIEAAIAAFRAAGAQKIIVGEGPGHRRDNEYLVRASGLYSVLKDHEMPYTDLNCDDVKLIKLRSHFTTLNHLYLPKTVLDVDLIVSMPKMKTHHWAGVTLSLKNMFGIVPGAIYGWPKNALHWAGIQGSILDINSSLPVPQFAIVDGIVGMEGNGPIQGQPRKAGVLVFGDDLVAVDATAARIMKIDPEKVPYIRMAGEFLGNISTDAIQQVAEPIERFCQSFEVIQEFQQLKSTTS